MVNHNGIAAINVGDGGFIDEVSVRPPSSAISTFIFEPSIGLTSKSQDNGSGMSFEFDLMGRLRYVKDGNGNNLYQISYPSKLSSTYPLITWGNGSGQFPKNYAQVLAHLASWDFIVIDNFNGSTYNGQSILESVKYMIFENYNSKSIFYNKIDLNNIAAVGHSQGASGVMNAATNFTDGVILKTIVTIELPIILSVNASKLTVPTKLCSII